MHAPRIALRIARAWRLWALVGALAAFGLGGWSLWHARNGGAAYRTTAEKDPYVRFEMEAYDAIQQNYWVAPGEYARFGMPELPELYRLAANKATGENLSLSTTTRAGVADMLMRAFSATTTEAKRDDAVRTLSVVLYNLVPTARDQLFSKAEETALRQTVANVNPGSDLYGDLGLEKNASAAAVEAAYKKKNAALANATSREAKNALLAAERARNILLNPVGKALYDQTGAEPSVESRTIGNTLYLALAKITPTTAREFAYAVDAASTTPGVSGMVIDLRGNIGGELSFAQEFAGLWLGGGAYAFDLYRQDDTEPERTMAPAFPELARFTDVAVLTDRMTQSTAELAASVMKRFRLGVVVGEKTRGWGSVENTYPLATSIDPGTSYSLLLVNHLTLRDDNQPIEQNGVVPNVDTSQARWQKELPQYFRSAAFERTLEALVAEKPSAP